MANSAVEYLTPDTVLAAYLIIEGFELLIITYDERGNGHPRGIYHFDETESLRTYVKQYNLGTATVNLATYERVRSGLLDRVMRGLP